VRAGRLLLLVLSFGLGSCAARSGTGDTSGAGAPVAGPSAAPPAPGGLPGSGFDPAEVAALAPGPPRVLAGGILFTFVDPSARSVSVAGTFNGWVPNQHELGRLGGEDSLWAGVVPLPSRGRYLYKFLVDGRRWVTDPAAERASDGAGGQASVVVVP
jgi:hypothetical protein